jgi:hypothetical protein
LEQGALTEASEGSKSLTLNFRQRQPEIQGLTEDCNRQIEGRWAYLTDTFQAYVVLNRASPNPKENDADGAREAIEGCAHLRLVKGMVWDRVAVKRAAPAGLTGIEDKPFDAKAAAEMQQRYALALTPRR